MVSSPKLSPCNPHSSMLTPHVLYITAGKASLKNEQSFCYLGSIIPDDASIDEEINNRISLKYLLETSDVESFKGFCVSYMLSRPHYRREG